MVLKWQNEETGKESVKSNENLKFKQTKKLGKIQVNNIIKTNIVTKMANKIVNATKKKKVQNLNK